MLVISTLIKRICIKQIVETDKNKVKNKNNKKITYHIL